MHGETIRSRVTLLLQRCRKAQRVYASLVRESSGGRASPNWQRSAPAASARDGSRNNRHVQVQVLQAQPLAEVHGELVAELARLVELPPMRELAAELHALRDRFFCRWKASEAELQERHLELQEAASVGEYVRVLLISEELVFRRAYLQACRSACEDLERILRQSRLSRPDWLPVPERVLESTMMGAGSIESDEMFGGAQRHSFIDSQDSPQIPGEAFDQTAETAGEGRAGADSRNTVIPFRRRQAGR